MTSEQRDPKEAVREIPRHARDQNPYPMAEGAVVVRYRESQDPDAAGWVVEANVGGVIMEGAGHYGDGLHSAREAASRLHKKLNAADPLRAILPEVVEALEKIRAFTGHMDSTAEEVTEAWKLSREALARLREIHPTTGGTDDGE